MSSLLGYTGAADVKIPFCGIGGKKEHKEGGTKSSIRMEGVSNAFGTAKKGK